MKIRRNRVIVAGLFLVWLGGMYFFLIGQHHSSFQATKSREEYVLRGRKVGLGTQHAESKYPDKEKSSNDVDKRKISDLDPIAYVDASKLKPNEDPYARNAYNQKESDKIAVDREVPDVRDGK